MCAPSKRLKINRILCERARARHAPTLQLQLVSFPKLVLFLLSLLLPGVCLASGDGQLAFVGTYTGGGSEGIYAFRFDPAIGVCTSPELAGRTENPSFIAMDRGGRFLYAVNEVDTFGGEPSGAVSVFAIHPGSGKLTLLQQVSSLGAGPAHLALDRSGRFLMVANYNSGNVAVFPVKDDGRLGEHVSFIQDVGSSVNPERQSGPHAHFIQTTHDNRFVLVADLGIDRVLIFRFDADTGSLTPNDPAFIALEPGAGPRHFVFSPSGKVLYVVNELASTVVVFAFDPITAVVRGEQTVSTLPETFTGTNTAAEIAIDARGRHLYASNRGDDSIVQFDIDPGSGQLTGVGCVPSGGKAPRHFEIDPTGNWLFAAHQDGGGIALFRVDRESGRLIPTPASLKIMSPVCVRILAVDDEDQTVRSVE